MVALATTGLVNSRDEYSYAVLLLQREHRDSANQRFCDSQTQGLTNRRTDW